ncbi:MAG: RNA polymerase factor sigma-54 [Candidatus Omnitrophica bacterium]|nr:RNA polymerase factor sigma-54 [Candidatus Omnitrophota bacterium]
MTPQLKLSLAILQKPILELKGFIDQVLTENPFLEAEGSPERELSLEQMAEPFGDTLDDWIQGETDPSAAETLQERRDYLLTLAAPPASLREELSRQLQLSISSPEELQIGEIIIGNLNTHGYLTSSIGEIARELGIKEEKASRVLAVIQSLEPVGVGARNLQECLMIQLKRKGREGSLPWKLVGHHFEDLAGHRFDRIAKRLKAPADLIQKAVKEIRTLDPKPGSAFGTSAQPMVPDLSVEKAGNRFEVECMNGYLPKLKVRTDYRSLLRPKTKDALSDKLKEKLQEALGLVKALEDRRRTMEKIAEALLKEQTEFFEKGPEYLKPLTAKELARKVGCHESTVSRAIAEKYIATPWGLHLIKDLFAKKVSTASGEEFLRSQLKEKVRQVLMQENPLKPLTDQGISEKLKAEGIAVARRTVSKYREELKTLPAHLRR